MIISDEPKLMFKRAAAHAVTSRDEKGNIPGQASLIFYYRQLNQTEKFAVRLWIDEEKKKASARLDTARATAWGQVRERVAAY